MSKDNNDKGGIVNINDRFRFIIIDENQYKLEEYREGISSKTKEKGMTWKFVGWFGDMLHMFNTIHRCNIYNKCDGKRLTLQEFKVILQESNKEISNLIKSEFKEMIKK